MSLKDRLNEDLRVAMRSGDETRKTTLRGLLAAVRNAEDAAAKQRFEAAGGEAAGDKRIVVNLADDEVIQVIRRQVRQRQDSIEKFQRADRDDLVAKESAEMALLEAYLPHQMGREQIAEHARAVIAETGAAGPADKGKVMSVIIPRLAGQADGREINAVVTELLAGPGG